MLTSFTLLLIGFSIFSSASLLFAYIFFLKDMRKTVISRTSCAALLIFLSALQCFHFEHLQTGKDLLESKAYVLLLLSIPPTFYFFSREVLLPGGKYSILQLIHFLPLLLGVFVASNIAAPFSFLIGTGYAFWFTHIVFGMRRQRSRFKIELFFFGLFALVALIVLILGLSIPYIDNKVFYITYANSTGIAMFLIASALIIFPELLSDITEAARMTYASSTLGGIDIEEKLIQLEHVMTEDKLYQNEDLNLSTLATVLEISAHQLSELINTTFSIGFSRYVRELRVAEAKKLLAAEPQTSVLAIGLMIGFKSQSNFYAAFREITGEAPGAYRKTT